MTDIVERLRSRPWIPDIDDPELNEWRKRMNEAADEIERLRAALEEIKQWMREPDFAEDASLSGLIDWVNRRPLATLRPKEEWERSADGKETIRARVQPKEGKK